MVASNNADGFTSPRRSARLATVEPLSPQKKKVMSPAQKRAHDLANTPRDDMELDVDVADKTDNAVKGTQNGESGEANSGQMDVDEPAKTVSFSFPAHWMSCWAHSLLLIFLFLSASRADGTPCFLGGGGPGSLGN
jgi:hypothetical protein